MKRTATRAEAQYFTLSDPLYPERSWRRYLELMFSGVELHGRSLLDVGGGSGAVSFYAAARGASAVCLEPAGDGANPRMRQVFDSYMHGLGSEYDVHVELVEDTLQNLDRAMRPFDVVTINNAINHLDEQACQALPDDRPARNRYLAMFRRIAELTAPGGYLIATDAGRHNLWNRLGRRSPFAPSIDWHIHQQPEIWESLLREAGFGNTSVRWNTHAKLGAVGQALLGNRFGGYLTNSHFILTMRRDVNSS
jgi:SAM-dependent methyltransferase